jgi:hypothetical protein
VVLVYHSRRTRSLSLVHVVELAMAASMAGRPLFCKSLTVSATQSTCSRDSEMKSAYRALRLNPTILDLKAALTDLTAVC